MATSVTTSPLGSRASDWIGFTCFAAWTCINATLAVGVFRRTPAVACLLIPTFAHEALIAVAFLIRRPLLNQVEGWAPRAVAYAATFLFPAFCFVSSVWQPQWMKPSSPSLFFVGLLLWMIGAYLGLWSLLRLRRAFSIIPQARTLVTDGPYRIARHPIYASYLLQYGGVALSHLTPAATIACLVWAIVVAVRIAYEERILAATFPEYESYRLRVGRFTPRFARRSRARAAAAGLRQSPPTEHTSSQASTSL
jgi:protein-S-isoprenylcysteine O-methyltransferase Ste14